MDGEIINFQEPLNWDPELIINWGRLLGKTHSLAKEYTVNEFKRYNFFLPDSLIDNILPDDEPDVITKIKKLHRKISSLTKETDGYGIIHSDLHPGNFLVRNKQIVGVFDFDRTCYKWFIADIAIALFYPLFQSPIRESLEDQKKFVDVFLPKLLQGYEIENKLETDWYTKLPDFIRLRDAVLYLYLPRTDEFQKFRSSLLDRITKRHPILDYIDGFVTENLIQQ
ncbi:MAG: phosphotransferase enzyme family protein [Candidatus Kariarchaeaceae archaeon]